MMSAAAFAQTLSVENFVREMPCKNDRGEVIAEKMGTIVLPYAPQVEGATLYQLVSASAKEWVFEAVSDPQANTPYVFVADKGVQEVRFYGDGQAKASVNPVADAAGKEGAFVGSYRRQIIRKQIYFLSFDRINSNDGKPVMSTPYRAYFDGSVLPEGTVLSDNVKLTFINHSGTSISEVEGDAECSIQLSRQQISLQPGTYQINGKKAVVK